MTGKYFRKLSLICGLVLAVTGCNSDIFVDAVDLPSFTETTIEGDGGQWKTPFVREGLVSIAIDPETSAVKRYFRYFNSDGREVDAECPASDLRQIVYENQAQFYSIGFDKSMIYVNSNYNALEEIEMRLWLEYDSGATKCIVLTITAGEPLEFVGAWYDGEIEVEDNVKQTSRTFSLSNNSHLTQNMEIHPYRDAGASDFVVPEESWAYLLTCDMPVLTYTSAGWERVWVPDITLGQPREFKPLELETEMFTVEVPPFMKAKVVYTLHYSRASQGGNLLYFNKESDQQFEVGFTCKAAYPTSCEYTVEYEDL